MAYKCYRAGPLKALPEIEPRVRTQASLGSLAGQGVEVGLPLLMQVFDGLLVFLRGRDKGLDPRTLLLSYRDEGFYLTVMGHDTCCERVHDPG
jgi:hypothetical protein